MSKEDNNTTDNLITVIDLGTESIRVMIARVESDGSLKMLGCGDTRTNRKEGCEEQAVNIRKGKVRNPSEVQRMLRCALEEALGRAGISALGENVYIGITDNVFIENVLMNMNTIGRGGVVTAEDITEFAHAVREHYDCLAKDYGKCLASHTRFFQLEDGRTVYDITGIPSKGIKANLQGAICRNETVEMLGNLVRGLIGLDPKLLYIPLAMGYAVDLDNELNNGVLMIDIGAGVVSFCVMRGGSIVHIGHLPVGCNHIENDVMQAFGIEWGTARNIVRKLRSDINADLMNAEDKRERMVTVEARGTRDGRVSQRQRRVPCSSIEKVIMLRAREMFTMVREELVSANALWHIGGTVILSGGGALIPGIDGVAASVFGKDVQIAKPANVSEKGIIYGDTRDVVPLGLLKLAMRDLDVVQNSLGAGEENLSAFKMFMKILRAIVNW